MNSLFACSSAASKHMLSVSNWAVLACYHPCVNRNKSIQLDATDELLWYRGWLPSNNSCHVPKKKNLLRGPGIKHRHTRLFEDHASRLSNHDREMLGHLSVSLSNPQNLLLVLTVGLTNARMWIHLYIKQTVRGTRNNSTHQNISFKHPYSKVKCDLYKSGVY